MSGEKRRRRKRRASETLLPVSDGLRQVRSFSQVRGEGEGPLAQKCTLHLLPPPAHQPCPGEEGMRTSHLRHGWGQAGGQREEMSKIGRKRDRERQNERETS